MKLCISSDSSCALPREKAEQLGIEILPLNVIVNGVEYHDGVDITNLELAEAMRSNRDIKTSTPTPYEIENHFDQIFAKGFDTILHFTISSHLSSMYTLFVTICKEKYGDRVIIIDSLAVCSLMLNNVMTAKVLADQGATLDTILATCTRNTKEGKVYFIPENLTALKKGGRISPAVAAIGNLIGLKPILILKDGAIIKDSTTRKVKVALKEKVDEFMTTLEKDAFDFSIVTFDTKDALVEYVLSLFAEHGITTAMIQPIAINVCAHAGPGTIGIIAARKIADTHILHDYL